MKKIIAFYLPQYHVIPENNRWWGEGFTEWTNTKKAIPLFEGHYQPKTPLNGDYYDLSNVEVMEKQAEMARKYGIYGFCYYHYWFKNGKKLLEMPIENMLVDKNVNIQFCLCWANENWSRRWDGGDREIIMQQDYGNEKDWNKHFDYLLNFFKDERYIRIDGRPVLLIYKPYEIDGFNEMIDLWNKRIVEEKFEGLIIVRQYPEENNNPTFDESKIDYSIKFEPVSSRYCLAMQQSLNSIGKIHKKRFEHIKKIVRSTPLINVLDAVRGNMPKLTIKDYDEAWHIILNKETYGNNIFNGAFVDWDNTARNRNGLLYVGASPEKFGVYIRELLKKPSPHDFIFINAWNEWAEGAYLEPDEKYGYAYLEALRDALMDINEFPN